MYLVTDCILKLTQPIKDGREKRHVGIETNIRLKPTSLEGYIKLK